MIWAFFSTLVGLLPIILKYAFREKKASLDDQALAISAREAAASRVFQQNLQDNRLESCSRDFADLNRDVDALLGLPEKDRSGSAGGGSSPIDG